MAIHFYDESPCGQRYQSIRLEPATALLKAGIPCVVFGEDALNFIHCIPTELFDLHLLVPEESIDVALDAICSSFPYSRSTSDPDKRWYDHPLRNRDRPYAFHLNSTTKLLLHNNRQLAWEEVCSGSSFVAVFTYITLPRVNHKEFLFRLSRYFTLTSTIQPAPVTTPNLQMMRHASSSSPNYMHSMIQSSILCTNRNIHSFTTISERG